MLRCGEASQATRLGETLLSRRLSTLRKRSALQPARQSTGWVSASLRFAEVVAAFAVTQTFIMVALRENQAVTEEVMQDDAQESADEDDTD